MTMKVMVMFFLISDYPNPFVLGDISPMILVTFVYKLGGDTINVYMQSPEIIKFMASGEKFDICIIEVFNAEAFLVKIFRLVQLFCML